MKYYAVVDTNVLVSAMLKWDSVPGNVMELVFHGTVVPLLNEHILKEYEQVLSRPKFHLNNEIIQIVITEIKNKAIFVNEEKTEVILPDPDDVVFYQVVMEQRKREDAYLVTGNLKHFPIKPYVVTPRRFIDIILEETN